MFELVLTLSATLIVCLNQPVSLTMLTFSLRDLLTDPGPPARARHTRRPVLLCESGVSMALSTANYPASGSFEPTYTA